MENEIKCAICGRSNKDKHIGLYHNVLLCDKHKKQMIEYGKIIDPTPRTTRDRNEIILHNDYAEMIIRNKKNEYICSVLIDKEDIDYVIKYKWNVTYQKGKFGYPNARINGKTTKLHKYLLQYKGNLVVDHINREILDNRKENLRIVPQAINCQNRTLKKNYIHKYGKNMLRVEITRSGKRYVVNTIKTMEEAIKIRDKMLAKIDGI